MPTKLGAFPFNAVATRDFNFNFICRHTTIASSICFSVNEGRPVIWVQPSGKLGQVLSLSMKVQPRQTQHSVSVRFVLDFIALYYGTAQRTAFFVITIDSKCALEPDEEVWAREESGAGRPILDNSRQKHICLLGNYARACTVARLSFNAVTSFWA